MSMKGVKARLIEEYEQLKKDFNKYFFKVHKKEQYFDPLSGYDQLMLKPEQPKKLNEYLLYSTYAQLRLLLDIKPDLRTL